MLPTAYLLWSFTAARVERVRRDERGLTTTELAVLTALLVTLAFAAVAGSALTDATVTATRDARSVTVEVHGESMAVVPFWHLPVSARSSGPVERFRNENEGFSNSEGSSGSNAGSGGAP